MNFATCPDDVLFVYPLLCAAISSHSYSAPLVQDTDHLLTTYSGKLVFSPISPEPSRILDLGTGAGQWASEGELADTILVSAPSQTPNPQLTL